MTFLAFLIFSAYLAGVTWLVTGLWRVRRAHQQLDQAIDEAIALIRPIGPEDDPHWSDQ